MLEYNILFHNYSGETEFGQSESRQSRLGLTEPRQTELEQTE